MATTRTPLLHLFNVVFKSPIINSALTKLLSLTRLEPSQQQQQQQSPFARVYNYHPVIHLQFWAYGSWDSLFPISMSPNCKLMSPKHYF